MSVAANQLIKAANPSHLIPAPVAASTHLYQGTLAFWNSSGYADDDTASLANRFAGVVKGEVDNSSGAGGDLNAELFTEGEFELTGSGFSQGNVGKECFASDNYTIAASQIANSVHIGVIVAYVSSTKLLVRIQPSGHLYTGS